tara:strand:+ start:609 stop:788 length:180 start_codon:yes stop_codon:yes gene_type:complete
MPRPRLAMNTKTYNLLMPLEDWQKLARLAHTKSLELGVYISVAHLLREAYKAVYYEELE